MSFKIKKHRIAAMTLAVYGIVSVDSRAHAQVNVNVSVNASSPITYANGAATATMPATGLGLCSSVYANMWGDPALPGDIAASGVQTVRYPGGSYSDIYNWFLNTANEGGWVGAHADMGNFFNVINSAGTQAMITVNYGSNTTNTMGAQPQEAAAEVAFADANPNIYGTSSDVTLGTDAAGVNWYTAGYWAKLRASTPAQYQSWATAAGDYNPAYAFLAIGHSAPENIQYWEIGNEIGGNGWLGYQWEYDLHAPYNNGNTNDNTGRYQNPLLSPTAYAQNLNQFATLMKQVDPNIKIGAGFDAQANSSGDKAILQTAGNNIDFGIIHWYPTGSLPSMITSTLPGEIANLRTSVQNNTNKGYNGIEIDVTEFGDGNSSSTTDERALFAADAYATGFENGLKNMNFQEMSTSSYLNGNGTVGNPGEVYYAIQMLSKYAATGDTFVSTSSNNSSLRIHADRKADGSIGLLFINDSTTSADNLSVTLNGASPLTSSGTLYQFGNANISGSTITAPTSQLLTNLGTSFSLTIPSGTIETLVIPAVYLSWDNAGGSGTGTTWDTSSQNWNSGSGPTNFVNAVNVNFTDNNNGHYAVALNTTVTPNLISVNNSAGNYTISGTGTIAGSGTLTKSGTGTLILNTANTYTGATAVNAGALNIQNGGALAGTSSVTVASGAALQLQGNISTTTAVGLTLNGTGTATNGALENVSGSNTYSGLITLGSNATIGSDAGTLTLGNTRTITGSGDNLTLTGSGNGNLASIIGTNTGTLTKSGSGTWTLTGASTYTGTTTISGGTLQLSSPTTVTAATPVASYSFSHLLGNTVINDGSGGAGMNGTLNLNGGTGYINTTGGPGAGMGALVLNGDGTTVDINSGITDLSSSSNWTVSAWIKTTQSGATILDKGNGSGWNSGYSTFYLGNGNNGGSGGLPDAVRWGGGWVAGNTSVTDGAWHLVTYTDAGGTKNIYVDGIAESLDQDQFFNSDTGSIVRIGFAPSSENDGEVPTSGSLSGINIYNTALSAAQVAGLYTAVTGGSPLPATTPVNITASGAALNINGQAQLIGSLAGVAGSSVQLGSGTLIVGGVNASTTFAGSILGTGGVLEQNGPGTLALSGANTYSGGTIVNAGLLLIEPTGTSTSALASGPVTITGGELKLATGASGGTGPAPTSPFDLTSLSITGSGQFDLNNNHIIIDYTGASPFSTIAGYVKSGYNNGGWNGPGIISTAAAIPTNGLSYGIGYADGADGIVSGLSSGQIEVAYTLLGDANLDGLVNAADFTILAANFNQPVTGWDQGDFNYDGLVNAADFTDLAANFNQSVSGAAVSGGDVAALDAFAAANGISLANVPEPASAAMMAMAGLGILRRRRRRN